MKLASYIKNGNHSYGVMTDNGIIDLGGPLGGQFADLKSLLAAGMEEAAAFVQDAPVDTKPVSYTHLTLPTIYSV